MLNDPSYNLFFKRKVLKTRGDHGFMDVYLRFFSLYLLMEGLVGNSRDQEV